MNYGLYMSASGVLTNSHRQDVIANNLANAQTDGFKQALVSFRQQAPEAHQDPSLYGYRHDLLDQLGGTVHVERSRSNWASGPLVQSHRPFDLALQGQGFFAVQDPASGQMRLSRDGRLTTNDMGQLVQQTTGMPLLDTSGRTVTIDPMLPMTIDEQGLIRQGDDELTTLRRVGLSNPNLLAKLGEGLYAIPENLKDQLTEADAQIKQGFRETSNVNPISELMKMIETSRAIQNNAQLIRHHDLVLDRAVNVLGRVQ